MEEKQAHLQAFLDPGEAQPGEKVLGAIPYSLSSTLVVTNQRVIGKSGMQPGGQTGGFEVEIAYPDLVEVAYQAGVPVFGIPRLRLKYRKAGGNVQEVTLRFPGRMNAFLLYRLSGFDPRQIYQIIMEQVQRYERASGIAAE